MLPPMLKALGVAEIFGPRQPRLRRVPAALLLYAIVNLLLVLYCPWSPVSIRTSALNERQDALKQDIIRGPAAGAHRVLHGGEDLFAAGAVFPLAQPNVIREKHAVRMDSEACSILSVLRAVVRPVGRIVEPVQIEREAVEIPAQTNHVRAFV